MSVIVHASSGPLSCEIRKIGDEGSVHLTGVISSSAALTGNVRFLLAKSGPSGASNINQGNAFSLNAGAETYVSNVTINLRHGDHATVELVATSGGGIACHAQAILKL
ncbi:curli-like amyloid fiber formation chaperone CsgH [Hyphomicrobium sp.]|uniref:curli-like amyloid fiber formation chaperone CsgH n=1 Tax=Hyphomicrobium sp. TaxID=82 RepID=UPI0035690374